MADTIAFSCVPRRARNFGNNIAWPSIGRVGINLAEGRPAAANIDHNLIWAPRAAVAMIDDAVRDWAGWRALGYDTHGMNADPRFTDAARGDFTLAAGSPAIAVGAARSGIMIDQAGRWRPRGAGADFGTCQARSGHSPP